MNAGEMSTVENALVWQEYRLPEIDRGEYPSRSKEWFDAIQWPADEAHLEHARRCVAQAAQNGDAGNVRCVQRTIVERVVVS